MYIATGKGFARDIRPSYLKGILRKYRPSSRDWQMTNAFLMRKNGCDEATILKKTNQMRAKYKQKPIKAPALFAWLVQGDGLDKKFLEKINIPTPTNKFERAVMTDKCRSPIKIFRIIACDERIKLGDSDVQKVRKEVRGKKLSDTQLAKEINRITGKPVCKRTALKHRAKIGAIPIFRRK